MTVNEFVAQHTHKNYCEIVIAPNGDIEYAVPSHLYKLMALTGKSKQELCDMIPRRAAPLDWLVEYLGYGVAWYETFLLPWNYTDDQLLTIKILMLNGIIRPHIIGAVTQEKTTCELLDKWEETGDSSYRDKINQKKPLELWR